MTKTQTVLFHLDAGHVLLDLGGVRTLLDTGCQGSFGDVPSIELLGQTYRLPPDLVGRVTVGPTVEGLRRWTPVSPSFGFKALLGLDILAGLTLDLDWVASTLTFTGTPDARALEHLGPAPELVDVVVAGTPRRAFIDTGAWRSYLVAGVDEGLPRGGTFTDYNPIFGAIEPETVMAPLTFEGRSMTLEVGVATDTLAAAIRSVRADVIVGTDVLVPTGRTRMVIPGRS